MPTLVNLPAIQRGDTVPYTYTFTDGTNPVDMRGRTIVMAFKESAYEPDSSAVLTKEMTLAMDSADAENGIVQITLERSETGELVPGLTYSYSFRVVDAGSPESIETTLMYGEVLVEDA